MTLDEPIGSLKIHKDKLRDREGRREEQAHLASGKGKSNKRHRGRLKKEDTPEGECEKKYRDKSNAIDMDILQLIAAAVMTKTRRLTWSEKRRKLSPLSYRPWSQD